MRISIDQIMDLFYFILFFVPNHFCIIKISHLKKKYSFDNF